MKKYIVFIFFALLISSCIENHGGHHNFIFEFYPKKVTSTTIGIWQKHQVQINGYMNTTYIVPENYIVKEDSMAMLVYTFNVSKNILSNPNITQEELQYYYSYLDDPLPSVEQQISDDYEKKAESNLKRALELANIEQVKIHYRTTEIRNLTITALNTPIFGMRAGESLNDFFDIEKYDPPVIFNAPSQTLLYGYSSKSRPVSIGEWLSLSPLASVGMYLVPNTKIDNLPVNVQFVVKMETADGLVLRDTTRMVTITR
ncbi:MAG: hypothetical protein BGN96_08090 [Bacteroidales bacterium 45-6]|nr:MAG: hypothetical protein BGN96_08090 [Bacteroidales bacterium 45-6]